MPSASVVRLVSAVLLPTGPPKAVVPAVFKAPADGAGEAVVARPGAGQRPPRAESPRVVVALSARRGNRAAIDRRDARRIRRQARKRRAVAHWATEGRGARRVHRQRL